MADSKERMNEPKPGLQSSEADFLRVSNFITRRDFAAWICQKMQSHYFILSWSYFPYLGLARLMFCDLAP